MSDRATRSSAALRLVVVLGGVGAFYWEMIWGEARPAVIGGALTMMAYPATAWIDRLRRERGEAE